MARRPAGALTVTQAARTSRAARVGRYPQHTFQLETRPYQIQPFMIAPVLPGETLKAGLLQSRVVTKPIRNPLIGWWNEYYLFYVKHRDLVDHASLLTQMMLNDEADMSSLYSAADVKYNHFANGINYTKLCLERVVATFFRDEGEPWDNGGLLDGLPLASANSKKTNFLDSIIPASEYIELDVDVDADADGNITASEVENARRQWEYMREMGMAPMSYDEWLGMWGMKIPKSELHEPELIRYARRFQYPSNTIDPATGTPSSAVSWSDTVRVDKDRLFKEPGFILGVCVQRPKVYLGNVAGSMAHAMDSARSWLPPVMSTDPATSLLHFPVGTGPVPTATDPEGYLVDVRDLLLYGDQFINFDRASTDKSIVPLPAPSLSEAAVKYPSEAFIDALFVKTGETAPDIAERVIRQDGVINLTILTHQQDTSR